MEAFLQTHEKKLLAGFFALLVVLALFLSAGYGSPLDEGSEQAILNSNLRSYAELIWGAEDPRCEAIAPVNIQNSIERDHGQAAFYPLGPLLLAFADQGGLCARMYHFYIQLLFLMGLFSLYRILRILTGKAGAAWLGVGMFWLSPRFFAEGYYNNKDMVLACLCLVVFWRGLEFWRGRGWASCVWFGLAGALASNLRLVGLEAFGLMGLGYLAWVTLSKTWSRRAFGRGCLALGSWLIVFVLITPASWAGFVAYWQYVTTASLSFTRWGGYVWYGGRLYDMASESLPWHYLPRLILLTTPPAFLPLALLWLFSWLRKRRDKTETPGFSGLFQLVMLVFGLIPILGAMAGDSVLYNGWRHFYFVYGPLVILAVCGIWRLTGEKTLCRRLAVGLAGLQMLSCGVYIVRNYPVEGQYFNILAGENAQLRYDADYWSLGAVEALRWVCENDPDEKLYLAGVCAGPYLVELDHALDLLEPEDRERVVLKSGDSRTGCEYLLVNTTYNIHGWEALARGWQAEGFDDWLRHMEEGETLAEIKSGQTVLWQIWRNPDYTD